MKCLSHSMDSYAVINKCVQSTSWLHLYAVVFKYLSEQNICDAAWLKFSVSNSVEVQVLAKVV